MQYILLQKDIDYRDLLNIIYDYKVIDLFQNPYSEMIVLNIWESEFNVSSNIFTFLTAHNLLFNFNICRYYMKKKLRFSIRKD